MINKSFGNLISKTRAASKSMLSVVLVLCLLAVMLPAGLMMSAGADAVPWDGEMEVFANYSEDYEQFHKDKGKQAYEIANAKQLAFLAALCNLPSAEKVNDTPTDGTARRYKVMIDVNGDGEKETFYFPGTGMGFLYGVQFKLTDDIDLANVNWTPINSFYGILDGNGKEIRNLSVNVTGSGGLFAAVTYNSVKNLTVKGSVTGGSYSGGITGALNGGADLINCTFIGDVTGVNRAGGLAGTTSPYTSTDKFDIINCSTSGTVTVAKDTDTACIYPAAGGLLGFARLSSGGGHAYFTNCYSTMTVSTTFADASGLGGLTGKHEHTNAAIVDGPSTFSNCYFGGIVNSSVPISPITEGCTATNTYYKAGSYTDTATGLAATEVAATALTDGSFLKTLNDNVDALKAAGTTGLSYWVFSDTGVPAFAVMPKVTGISVSCGNVAFEETKYTYLVPVSNKVTSTTVTATVEDPATTKLTINTVETESNTPSAPITLTPDGVTTITVKAERDGFAETYTIEVIASTAWDGSIATEYAGGDGSEAEPYQILTPAQLAFLAEQANESAANTKGKYFELATDIDLGGILAWTPIGTGTQPFSGYFDGKGYTISNLYLTDAVSDSYLGFFGVIDGGTVKNLNFVDAKVQPSSVVGNIRTGGLVGTLKGASGLYNVSFDGDIVVSGGTINRWVGGLVGAIESGTAQVVGCSTAGILDCQFKAKAGGIIGSVFGGASLNLLASYSTMDVIVKPGSFNTTTSNWFQAGGLIGNVSTSDGTAATVKNVFFAGTFNCPHPITFSTANITVENDVYLQENWYTGTDGAVAGGAGIDSENPTARVMTTDAFKNGTVTALLNQTTVGENSWKDGTDHPVIVVSAGGALVTGAAVSGALTFDPAVYTYTISLPYSVESFVVIPTLAEQVVATVNGQAVQSGAVSQAIALTVGEAQDVYLQAKLGDVVNTYMFKVTRLAQAPEGVWDGGYEAFDTSNNKGTTIENPIIIENASQLAFLGAMTNGDTVVIGTTVYAPPEATANRSYVYRNTYFELAADIKLNVVDDYANWATTAPTNVWTPIGFYRWDATTASRTFCGILNGNNHTISGLYVNQGSNKYDWGAGLFGATTNATIRNLHIEDAYVAGYRNVGGLIGRATDNWDNTYPTLQNCSYSGIVKSYITSGLTMAGGLVGGMYPGAAINSCWTEGTVSGGSYVGGLVGWAQLQKDLTIVNSYSVMDVQSGMTTPEAVAGLVGGFEKRTATCKITRSYFAGKVPTNTPIIGNQDPTTIYEIDGTTYYRADSYVGPVNNDLVFDALEKSVEEFDDGTVTKLLNDAAAYGDFWHWKDGENGYPVSDGVLLITDYRTHTDDSLFEHSTVWADKFVNKDGGVLKGSDDDADDDANGSNNVPATGERSLYVVAIVLLLLSAASVTVLARRQRSQN